jgi:hypothetical protein
MRKGMSEPEAPREDRSLQDGQDVEAPETRSDEEEGPSRTAQARTDLEQDDEGGPADS